MALLYALWNSNAFKISYSETFFLTDGFPGDRMRTEGRMKSRLLIFWIGCIGIWSVLPVYGAEAESRILLKAGDRYSNYRIPGLVATANGTLLAVA